MPDLKTLQGQWHVNTLANRLGDATVILLGWWLSLQYLGAETSADHAFALTLAVVFWYCVCEVTGMYRNWRGVSIGSEFTCVGLTWLVTVPLVSTAMTLFDIAVEPEFLGSWLFFSLTWMGLCRFGLRVIQRQLRIWGYNIRGYAILGINDLGLRLARSIQDVPSMGLKLVGFFDDRVPPRVPEIKEGLGRQLGDINTLVEKARSGEVSVIYITFPMRGEERIRYVLSRLADSTASVYLVPDFYVFEMLHARWSDVVGIPTVSVFENPFYGVDGFVKRALDFVIAFVLLIVLAIPMAVIALGVTLTSKGPVFFRQRRYGLDGQEILVWKFRTMTVCEDGDSVIQAKRNDSRITPFGKVLRNLSLDELPQVFNVLNGTMSLVGPRPHATAHNEEYRLQIQGYMLRHKVKPGITGLAQVNGYRGETDTLEKMERRIECDHRYIREWSFLMDIMILLKTLYVVLARRNAY